MDIIFRFKTDDPRHMDVEDINLAFFRTADGRTVGIDRRRTIWNCADSGEVSMVWSRPYLWEVDGCIPFDDEDDSSAVLPDRLMGALLDGAKFLYFSLYDGDNNAMAEIKDVKFFTNAEKAIRVKARGGMLIAETSLDPDNPGISVCYQPDGSDSIINLAYIENTDPELRDLERNPDPNDIRVMVYENPYQEDYTYERLFNNAAIRNAMDL